MKLTKKSQKQRSIKNDPNASSGLISRRSFLGLSMLALFALALYKASEIICAVTRLGWPRATEQQHDVTIHNTPANPSDIHFSKNKTVSEGQTSKGATVMGMAYNYDVRTFQLFVGSLRRTGYQGHIILAVSPNPASGVEDYLQSQNVTMKRLTLVDCKVDIVGRNPDNKDKELDGNQQEVMTCAHPHDDLKIRWGRFALLRDYLEECQECTGPVLLSDVRDTFFQRDPFGPDAPPVTGLQVFEEHRKQRTTHWLVQFPVEQCKKTKIFDEVMLCSGTTIGTRESMLRYLKDMVTEMREWMKDDDCCCIEMNGDDQAIHNWMFYSGALPYATPQPNRKGLVNTVGVQGAIIGHNKRQRLMEQLKIDEGQAESLPYTSIEDEAKGLWLGDEYDQTDEEGYFLDFNGERSFIVHQFDRYGRPLDRWIWQHGVCKGM